MQGALLVIVKVLPLAIFIRSACCKFEVGARRHRRWGLGGRKQAGPTGSWHTRTRHSRRLSPDQSSRACLQLPVFGCDGPLCPAAIGQPADCEPTANTAELKAWCENGWVPWANGLLEQARTAGVPIPAEVAATCTEADGWHLMKLIGAIEVAGYSLLWINPEVGYPWGKVSSARRERVQASLHQTCTHTHTRCACSPWM